MRAGDDCYPSIMDEGLIIDTILPRMSDREMYAFYRRVYRIERDGYSRWMAIA